MTLSCVACQGRAMVANRRAGAAGLRQPKKPGAHDLKFSGWLERRGRFKALRKALGMTQQQVSMRAERRWDLVRQIEAGYNRLTVRATLVAIAKGYGLSPESFDAFLAGTITVAAAAQLARGEGVATDANVPR